MLFGIKNKKKDYKNWQKKHPNFMTPYVIKSEEKNNYIVEVSEGEDFNHNKIYGVSLIKRENGTFTSVHDKSDKSKMFYSRDEAFNHAKKIKSEL